jgi:hypothetical protein
MLGHDGPPESFWRKNLLTGKPLERCPVRTLQLATPHLVDEIEALRTEIWPLWEKGLLLSAGGIEDQSARYLDYMREFDLTQRMVEAKAKEIASSEADSGAVE